MIWNKGKADRVFKYLCNALKTNSPKKRVFKMATKLYFLQKNQTPFLLLVFNNLKAMRECHKLVASPRSIHNFCRSIKLSLHETKVNQVRKLLTQQDCGMSQWFSINGRHVSPAERVSHDHIPEYMVQWKTMKPLDLDTVTHAGILSWDIESYSDNIKAFPDAWNARDIAYMISCVYRRHGTKEGARNICIIWGVSKPPNKGDEYIYVNNELELIRKFEEIILELDPEVLIGYNIHGFDYPYLDKRLRRLGQTWGNLGCIKDEPAIMKSMSWASSGFGHNDINILQMSGRISVDLLPLVKREYKLPKYNLDTVANHFLKTGKDPVTAQDMFKIVKCMLMLEDVVEHLNPDPRNMYGMTDDEKDAILYRIRNTDKLIKWAIEQNKDKETLNVQQLNQLIDLINYVNDQIKVVADYCIKDSIVVIDLFNKLNIWIYLIQVSTITGVTPMELFTRGQQARGLSVVYNLAAKTGYVVDSKLYPKDSFAGGFVWDPVPGVYDFVICLDFRSLYPNIIRAYNICWTTFVPAWLDHLIKDDDCNVIEWDDKVELAYGEKCDNIVKNNDNKDCKLVHRRERFVKPHIKRGLLPDLVGNFIDKRNEVREVQKHYKKGTVDWVICENRQLAMKQTGNSMYGLLGVTGEGGVLPLPEAAAAVTAYGRKLIHFSNDYIVEKYGGKVVYNDTDSTMVQIPGIDNGPDANAWGLKLERELSAIFPDPLYLEFEKAGRQFCIAKKNYVYWIYNKKGEYPRDEDGRPLYMSRGIPLARRDKAGWQRGIVGIGLDMIIEKENHQVFLDMVVEKVVRTLREEMPWRDFIIIRGLGAGYKIKTYFMKIFAEELQKLGRPAQPGDRLEYVIVKTDTPDTLLGRRMRDPETYYRRLGTDQHEPIDYEYYIEHFLMDCIEKYWQIAYKDVIAAAMESHRIEDYCKVLEDVRYAGFDSQVAEALVVNEYDPERAVKALLLTPLKNKVITARRAYITGRHVYDCRLNDKPIKSLLKGYRIGRLEEAVKSLASPEVYRRLYPNNS